MKNWNDHQKNLVMTWDHADLIEAMELARERANDGWEPKTAKMWADRAKGYEAELNRRYKLNRSTK